MEETAWGSFKVVPRRRDGEVEGKKGTRVDDRARLPSLLGGGSLDPGLMTTGQVRETSSSFRCIYYSMDACAAPHRTFSLTPCLDDGRCFNCSSTGPQGFLIGDRAWGHLEVIVAQSLCQNVNFSKI